MAARENTPTLLIRRRDLIENAHISTPWKDLPDLQGFLPEQTRLISWVGTPPAKFERHCLIRPNGTILWMASQLKVLVREILEKAPKENPE